jgi:PTH1 family peptidyl-tRNA hydrolase
MKYLVGLGNPGSQYQATRHNIGFMVVEKVAELLELPTFSNQKKTSSELTQNRAVMIIKPHTFMNDSGRAVRAVLQYYGEKNLDHLPKLEQLLVCHDDLDLPLGSCKIQLGTGPKIHNGLLSLYQHLGTTQFWHVRLGIDGRKGDRSMPGHAYVLGQFLSEEKAALTTMIEHVAQRLISEHLS